MIFILYSEFWPGSESSRLAVGFAAPIGLDDAQRFNEQRCDFEDVGLDQWESLDLIESNSRRAISVNYHLAEFSVRFDCRHLIDDDERETALPVDDDVSMNLIFLFSFFLIKNANYEIVRA